ncbi:MAG: MFS transporter [Deltaproteobacteria bacterium]|nr:MFS transporter [Deltaproteobacteria bacterium]
MEKPLRLITKEFLSLNGIIFLNFCNVAVFFQFHHYLLNELRRSPQEIGLLIGLFALTGLVIRPLISPLLHPGNAKKWIFLGSIGIIVSLLFYQPARGFWSMALVRVIHGGVYVVMGTAMMAKIVETIPPGKSSQAFGVISVITLLPYAVMPPILEPLIKIFGGFIPVLNLTALLMVLVFPLLLFVKGARLAEDPSPPGKITKSDLIDNIKDRKIFSLLAVSLLLYVAFTPVFYFLKAYGHKIGIPNPGWFFTLSTFTEIAVRLFGGPFFDKMSKPRFLAYSLIGLAVAYPVLANTSGKVLFYALGLFFGLCWGVAMPLLSGLLFDSSPAKLRALNTNLGVEMFQGSLFLGPIIGGWILAGWDYRTLYCFCGALILLSLSFIPLLSKKGV